MCLYKCKSSSHHKLVLWVILSQTTISNIVWESLQYPLCHLLSGFRTIHHVFVTESPTIYVRELSIIVLVVRVCVKRVTYRTKRWLMNCNCSPNVFVHKFNIKSCMCNCAFFVYRAIILAMVNCLYYKMRNECNKSFKLHYIK